MNLAQLEYIVALDQHRHFANAAAACFVTQPTLSMMVQKLEDELATKIFDRSKKPLVPTETGVLLIEQARRVLQEAQVLKDIVVEQKGILEGELRLGIIPTLAPYLLPLFIKSFMQKYPKIHLKIAEYTTEVMTEKLKRGQLDAGILVTPLQDAKIKEMPLFYETFFVYASHDFDKEYLLPEDLNPNELWLLEEGHCFRSQILNLCEIHKQSDVQLEYAAGSLETLRQLVDNQQGVTILPELAIQYLSPDKQQKLKSFQSPAPVREVSLVTHRDFIKRALIAALEQAILSAIPEKMKEDKRAYLVEIGHAK